MKLFKTVTATDLENASLSGWQLHGAPHTEKRFVEERRDGYYGNPNDKRHVEFGDVLVFIVWKDNDQATREQKLEQQLHDAHARLRELDKTQEQVKESVAELVKLRADMGRLEATAEALQKEQVEERHVLLDQSRKLEGDLAKVRKAIGELKWKEIVDG